MSVNSGAQSGGSSGAGEGPILSTGQDAGGDGGDVDLDALYEHIGAQSEELKNTRRDLMGLKGTNEKNQAFLDRLRQAVVGEEKKSPSRKDELEGQLDHYLRAALEAERKGKPMPLTANLASQFFESQIRAEEEKAELQKRIDMLEKAAKRANDPRVQIDNAAYSDIDSLIENGVRAIYGVDDAYADQREHQFEAIARQIGNVIKQIRTEDPQTWNRLARNPGDRRKLVTHFIEKNIPPKARQVMEQERLRNTPLTVDDMMQAFGEAKGIKDPKVKAQMTTSLRRDILAESFAQRRGKGGVFNRLSRGERDVG